MSRATRIVLGIALALAGLACLAPLALVGFGIVTGVPDGAAVRFMLLSTAGGALLASSVWVFVSARR